MKRKEVIKMLRPMEVMKRIKSAATIVAIGPSSSGKSTLIYALVNHRIVTFISKGIGDKSQTTLIPCTFLFDERMEEQYFSLKIKVRKFTVKDISVEMKEQLAILFASNSACAEDTLDSIDDVWMERILEPDSASYHLGTMKDEITAEKLKEALEDVMKEIEGMEASFEERVNKRKAELKKNPPKEKAKITDIRRMVFSEMWDEVDKDLLKGYTDLLAGIGEKVERRLQSLIGEKAVIGDIQEYSVERKSEYPYGGYILEELFNPYNPFSLIIEEMILACKPREGFLHEDEEISCDDELYPIRFCLRDTMGLTQLDTKESTIKDALDIALNCSPDSILLLINLTERDDIISRSIDAIVARVKNVREMNIPINVFYTKADIILDNLIYKNERSSVDINQQNYDENIIEAINSMEKMIAAYSAKLPEDSAVWLSLRFKDKNIDPIQMALQKKYPDKANRFKPQGLYANIEEIIAEAQSRIFPKGMMSPLVVQVLDYDKPAISFQIDSKKIAGTTQQISKKLTEDKATYNRYLIIDEVRIHGRSVVNYYYNLQKGRGYQTNANVYGNFNINMKAMLYNLLCEFVMEFTSLYEEQAVSTITSNLSVDELNKMVAKFDEHEEITRSAYADVNPAIWKNVSENDKMSQKLHLIFRHYFASSDKYYMVMNRVALQISYRNEWIKSQIDNVYFEPLSYDATIRKMQRTYREIFASEKFLDIIAEEIGDAMTELANKMFVTI